MWLRWMALSAVLGCRGSALSKGDDSDVDIMDGPTFYQDVLPIVGENCQACHNETASMGSAFPLESYAHVAPIAEVLLAKMQPEGDPDDDPFFMPPFYARTNLECATWLDWKGTYQASQTDVSIFEAWIAAGKQEGDPESPADFVPREVTTLEGDDLIEVAYHGSYTVPEPEPDNYDSFRCFAVETSDGGQIGLTDDVWVDGFEFIPGNSQVVHHMLAYTVPGLEAHLNDVVEDPSNNSWDCAGGVSRADGTFQLAGSKLVYGWVPGSQPLSLEDGIAMRLEAGTGVVLQVHYNTLSVGDEDDRTDLSTMRMRRTVEPEREARIRLFGVAGASDTDLVEDPPFMVPLGAVDHVESYAEVMPDAVDESDVRIWGVVPHMHLAGTSIKFTRTRTTGEDDCLAHVPKWDFNWQQFYVYEGDFDDWPRLGAGETLRLSCTLDNSEDNIFLNRYLGGPVADGVELGEATSEEMCLIAVGLACDGMCPSGI